MKEILESLKKRFTDEELEEDNTSASVDGYSTPFAFSKKEKKVADSVYSETVPETHRFYKKMAEAIKKIDAKVNRKKIQEINYNDFKSDESSTERQKINLNIKEINRQLHEVERMINHAARLKTESGANNSVFWKGTLGRFQKINEKLLRISSKIREMNS